MPPASPTRPKTRTGDYDRIEVRGGFENLTSRAPLMPKGKEDAMIPVDLQEIDEKSLVAHVAIPLGSVGHHIGMRLEVSHGKTRLRLDCTAKVAEQEQLGDGYRCHLRLLQFTRREWEDFREFYESAFDRVVEQFDRLKG